MRIWALLLGHCLDCTALSGCYFANNNLPTNVESSNGLLHPNCDCFLVEVSERTINDDCEAVCPISKFVDYIFSDKYVSNGKKALFNSFGFTIEDSYKLKREYERQAREQYINGDYIIKKIDKFGLSINILITLVNKNGREYKFYSGWKVYPEGLINCNTPYGARYEKI